LIHVDKRPSSVAVEDWNRQWSEARIVSETGDSGKTIAAGAKSIMVWNAVAVAVAVAIAIALATASCYEIERRVSQ
jgi:hypothetical protein